MTILVRIIAIFPEWMVLSRILFSFFFAQLCVPNIADEKHGGRNGQLGEAPAAFRILVIIIVCRCVYNDGFPDGMDQGG